METQKVCFVLSPIGREGSVVHARAKKVLEYIIKPVSSECGYRAIRGDEIAKPGMITSHVIEQILEAPLVIADLTGGNPNVFYELALRHAIRKPCIQLIENGEKLPFDVAPTRTIRVNHRDLESAECAKKQIREQILSLEACDDEVQTPVSLSLDLKLLRSTEDPQGRTLVEVMEQISDLRHQVEGLAHGIRLLTGAAQLSDELRSVTAKFGEARRTSGDTAIELDDGSMVDTDYGWALAAEIAQRTGESINEVFERVLGEWKGAEPVSQEKKASQKRS